MINDETIQRLVDGELDPSEYQEVLLALEADPSTCESNAWRRCALGFLESQAFQFGAKSWLEARQRGEPAPELLAESPSPVTAERGAAPRRGMPLWMTFLTVAASLAGAFWIGGLMGEFSRPAATAPEVATLTPAATGQPTFEQFSSDGSVFVSMPVIDEGAFDREAWLAAPPTPLPVEMQRRWERLGYTIRASRRLIPKTVDGRTIYAPIEQYEMVPSPPLAQ